MKSTNTWKQQSTLCVDCVLHLEISQLQQNQRQIAADTFFPRQKFFTRNTQVISYYFLFKKWRDMCRSKIEEYFFY